MKKNKNIEAVVLKKYGTVLKSKNLELRLVKWVPEDTDEDDVEAKFDLRSWYVDDKVEHANKATATFTKDELEELVTNLAELLAKGVDTKTKKKAAKRGGKQ